MAWVVKEECINEVVLQISATQGNICTQLQEHYVNIPCKHRDGCMPQNNPGNMKWPSTPRMDPFYPLADLVANVIDLCCKYYRLRSHVANLL